MKRLFSLILAFVAMAIVGVASPAHANGAGAYGCADPSSELVRICLHDSINTIVADGYWQRDMDDLPGTGYGCVDLSQHSWHNGGTVADNTSSLTVTTGPFYASLGEYWKVRFYDHINCSSANGYFDVTVTDSAGFRRLTNLSSVGSNWYNRIGSLQIFHYV